MIILILIICLMDVMIIMTRYECLNPILATFSNKESWTQDLSHKYNKVNIIGNLKHLAETKGNKFILDLLERDNILKLPCRHCINCQIRRSREWAVRNSLEAQLYNDDECLFFTLTYNNDSISRLAVLHNHNFQDDIFSLSKVDLQLFIKLLRRKFCKNKIRYYACGEYGGITLRPHYHILIYGLSIDDIKYYKDSNGKTYEFDLKYKTRDGSFYYSEFIEDYIWKKGFVDISSFSDYTSKYVSQYVNKKNTTYNKRKGYIYYNMLSPEFNIMSLKPAIANDYIIKNFDSVYKDDVLLFHIRDKTMELKPFQFFDKKFDIERPDEFEFVKQNRKDFAKLNKYFDDLEFNLNISEYLRNLENERIKEVKAKEKKKL